MKAKWIKSQSCVDKGKVVAEVEAEDVVDFKHLLINKYAYHLRDSYSFQEYCSLDEVKDFLGGDTEYWPKTHRTLIDNQVWPVLEFTSNSGTEFLFNPSPEEVIEQIRGEDYGDLILTITD